MSLFLLISLALVVSVVTFFFLKNKDLKKWQSLLFAILTPILTAIIYLYIGTPDALNPNTIQSNAISQHSENVDSILAESEISAEQIQKAIETLEAKILDNPKDLESLNLLANTYLIADQSQQAVITLEKLIAQGQNDPDTLIKTVDAYAYVEQGVFNLRAKQLLSEAMQKAPNHPQGLWLSGMAAMQSNDTETAKEYWNRLLPLLGDTTQAQQLKNILIELDANQGNSPLSTKTENQDQASIKVTVTLGSKLREIHQDLKDDTFVFIIARAKQGSNVPLAATRVSLSDLPIDIEITGQDAMIPGNSIEDFNNILLSAKVSRSGDPGNTEGDINSPEIEVDMQDLLDQYTIEIQ